MYSKRRENAHKGFYRLVTQEPDGGWVGVWVEGVGEI